MQGKNNNWLKLKKLFKNKSIKIGNEKEHLFNFEDYLQKEEDEQFYIYKFVQLGCIEIRIPKPEKELSLEIVSDTSNQKLDTTGFLMWPCEEILTIYLLVKLEEAFEKGQELFDTNKQVFKILEIGAGYSGLCAITISLWMQNKIATHPEKFSNIKTIQINITDAVDGCIQKIQKCIDLNILNSNYLLSTIKVETKAEIFNWKGYETYSEENSTFDLIIGADVLFFRNYHKDLADTINSLLGKSTSRNSSHLFRAVIMAPDRDFTLSKFLQIFEEFYGTKCEVTVEELGNIKGFEEQFRQIKDKEGYMEQNHNLKILEIVKN